MLSISTSRLGRIAFLFVGLFCLAAFSRADCPALNPEHPDRLPARIDGRLIHRDMGCWFVRPYELLDTGGYKTTLDRFNQTTGYDLLCVSSRSTQDESVSPEAMALMRAITSYAEHTGIGIIFDGEIRLSRKAFRQRYPDLLAERLVLTEQAFKDATTDYSVSRSEMNDHYSHNYTYTVERARLVRAWSYRKNDSGEVLPETITDVTGLVDFNPEQPKNGGLTAHFSLDESMRPAGEGEFFVTVAIGFAYLYPDLYSDEAYEFEADLFRAHRDIPFAGCIKDEWGFLPCFTGIPDADEISYSPRGAALYETLYPGRNLCDDAFLMFLPQAGKQEQRAAVIDGYNTMKLDRVVMYEEQLYRLTKEFWGDDAMVAVHPTWYFEPVRNEFRKNALSWWQVPRDFAQTDEQAPFPCRMGLSKTEGRAWYNEYYNNEIPPYLLEIWSSLLGGGRVNIHPYCCGNNPNSVAENINGHLDILAAGAEQARQRIRILDCITSAPLDSPVALVFGHFGVMNWTRPQFNTVMSKVIPFCQCFSSAGYPADVIPSSQIQKRTLCGAPCWRVGDDGYLRYGCQPYWAIVLYAETPSDQADFEALRALARGSKTRVIAADDEAIAALIAEMTAAGLPTQTPWESRPAMSGFARLCDGTLLWANASLEEAGGSALSIDEEVAISADKSVRVRAEATGLFACRFAEGSIVGGTKTTSLQAVAGSSLKRVEIGDFVVSLDDEEAPCDWALWRDGEGAWHGIFQASENRLPKELEKLTGDWRWIKK